MKRERLNKTKIVVVEYMIDWSDATTSQGKTSFQVMGHQLQLPDMESVFSSLYSRIINSVLETKCCPPDMITEIDIKINMP